MAAECTPMRRPDCDVDSSTMQALPGDSPPREADEDVTSNISFSAEADHFAFTPKRVARLPRAWERIPATPFAPRTDTQKIWKRVPLQDRTTHNTIEIRRNETDDAEMRAIKRVRLTTLSSDNGKENYACSQWHKQSDNAKRKAPREQETFLQSIESYVDPLRGDCNSNLQSDRPISTPLEIEADCVIRRLDEMQQAEELANNDASEENLPGTELEEDELLGDQDHPRMLEDESIEQSTPQTPIIKERRFRPVYGDEGAAVEGGPVITANMNDFFTDSVVFDDQDTDSEITEDPSTTVLYALQDQQEDRPEASDEQSQHVLPPSNAPMMYDSWEETRAICQAEFDSSPASFEQQSLWLEDTSTEGPVLSKNETVASVPLVSSPRLDLVEDEVSLFNNCETIPVLVETAEDISKQGKRPTSFEPTILEQAGPRGIVLVSESNIEQAKAFSESETSLSDKEKIRQPVIELQIPLGATEQDSAATESTQTNTVIIDEDGNNPPNQLFTPRASTLSAPEVPPSDDTAYLHDFLIRARARKAARAGSSPENIYPHTGSPTKDTSQVLANPEDNPRSPSRSVQIELKQVKVVEDTMTDDRATSPCRRSTRPHLPKPLKSIAPAISNTIPVRRSNGTEFVFLQRTETMQIALDTRTNTKRNKGEAVPPVTRLEALAKSVMSPVKEKKKSSKARKAVKWDEMLNDEEQPENVPEEQTAAPAADPETKPDDEIKVDQEADEQETVAKAKADIHRSEKHSSKKKVKRLGTVNGTPAPKKVMAATATALPVPTRMLRARTKV